MTSLIIGASGQVGSLLYSSARVGEPCIGTYCRHAQPGLHRLDLREEAAVRKLLLDLRPSVCYLPAALTYVDYAETHPDECEAVNVGGVENLARALTAVDGVLVFFSTEHVFDNSPAPRREDEPTSARSVYARSKARAERIIQEILPGRHLILRTSWVFGPDPQEKNFVYRVLRAFVSGERLTVPEDQHGQPSYGPDVARAARTLVRRRARGIFHVVGPRYLSRLAWGRMIADRLQLPRRLLEGQKTADVLPAAYRPLHVRLDRRKLSAFFGTDPIRAPAAGVDELARSCVWQSAAAPARS